MADEYIVFPVETDPDEIAETAYAAMRAAFPNWEPSEGHVETWLIRVVAQIAADLGVMITDVSRAVFRAWGDLVGVPPLDAAPAVGAVTVTAVDNAGYTVPAGMLFAYEASGDTLIGFEVTTDVVILPGATYVSGVPVQAVEAGVDGNGLSGALVLDDAVPWVDSVAFDAVTGGGEDDEPDDQYLARLSRELELSSPRPILPDDFAVIARRVAGVGRATAVDGLDPVGHTTGNERMVTVAVTAPDGTDPGGTVRGNVKDLLESMREVSFTVHVIAPAYQAVSVAAQVTVKDGYDQGAVTVAAVDELTGWLSPLRWGLPESGDASMSGGWLHKPTVHWAEAIHVLYTVEGVDQVLSLTVNGGTSNVSLNAGDITLPTPGTITVTV